MHYFPRIRTNYGAKVWEPLITFNIFIFWLFDNSSCGEKNKTNCLMAEDFFIVCPQLELSKHKYKKFQNFDQYSSNFSYSVKSSPAQPASRIPSQRRNGQPTNRSQINAPSPPGDSRNCCQHAVRYRVSVYSRSAYNSLIDNPIQ